MKTFPVIKMEKEVENKKEDRKMYKKCYASFEFGEDKLYWRIDDIDDFNDFIKMYKLIVDIKNKDKKKDIEKVFTSN